MADVRCKKNQKHATKKKVKRKTVARKPAPPNKDMSVDRDSVRIDYILEVWKGNKVIRAIPLPMQPANFTLRLFPATAIRMTLGMEAIRDPVYFRRCAIHCSGRSGVQARLGYGEKGTAGALDSFAGPRHVENVDAFLKEYQKEVTESGAHRMPSFGSRAPVESRLRLALLVFGDFLPDTQPSNEDLAAGGRGIEVNTGLGHHWFVEVQSWIFSKDRSFSPYEYQWSLDLAGYQPVKRDAQRGWAEFSFKRVESDDEWSGPTQGAKDILDLDPKRWQHYDTLLRDITAAKAPITRYADAMSKGLITIAKLPAQVLAEMVATSRQLYATVHRAYVALRYDFVTGTVSQSAMLVNSLVDLTQLLGITHTWHLDCTTLFGNSPAVPIAQKPLLLAAAESSEWGQASGVPLTQAPEGQSLSVYVVKPGDSLQSIALTLLGDANLWTQIADLNNMPDATHFPSGQPMIPGSMLTVPQSFYSPATDGWGSDLLVDDETGDLVASKGSVVYDDIVLVRGPQNLEQALRIRVRTIAGDVPQFPDFGLPSVIGKAVRQGAMVKTADDIVAQVERDDRVVGVSSLEVSDLGDALVAELVVQTIAGDSVGVAAPLGTV